jgi:hypothetical protein
MFRTTLHTTPRTTAPVARARRYATIAGSLAVAVTLLGSVTGAASAAARPATVNAVVLASAPQPYISSVTFSGTHHPGVATPAPASSSKKSVFPESFSGSINGYFKFAGFQYRVKETFNGTISLPCLAGLVGGWVCDYYLSDASGTITGTHTNSEGHSKKCSVPADGLTFGKGGSTYAVIVLGSDHLASVEYQSGISAYCNAGWAASNDGNDPPASSTLHWKLGKAARWKVIEFEFTPSPVKIKGPLKITWDGRYTP